MPTYTCTHIGPAGSNFVHTHTASVACAAGAEDPSCPAELPLISCAMAAAPPAPPAPPTTGLSTGAKIAIGVGIVVVVVAVAWWLSDARLKRDISLVRRLPNGIGLYRFRYLDSEVFHVGVLAQEVAAIDPAAVRLFDDGWLRVDYARLELDPPVDLPLTVAA